jgi:deazaflavin-dependent oxidoreductase (nitroreductase family)
MEIPRRARLGAPEPWPKTKCGDIAEPGRLRILHIDVDGRVTAMSQDLSHLSLLEQTLLVPLLRLHNRIYQMTNGCFGQHIPGLPPSLLLHTRGAKTGALRTVTLTYARDGHDLLVVASLGGAPNAPGWYHHLLSEPKAEINIGAKRIPVIAQPVIAGEPSYERLWRAVNDSNSNHYDGHQERTSRPIPVVRLTPISRLS